MNMIRSGPIPRKQQTKRLEELAAACTAKIRDEVLPALRVRAESALGGERWEIVIDRMTLRPCFFATPARWAEEKTLGMCGER